MLRANSKIIFLDLAKGYHQLNLDTGSYEYTEFTMPKEIYDCNALLMGMKIFRPSFTV